MILRNSLSPCLNRRVCCCCVFVRLFVAITFSLPFLRRNIILCCCCCRALLFPGVGSFCPAYPSFPPLRSYVVLLLCSVLAALAGLESTKSVYSNSWSQTPVAPGRPHHHRLCFSHQTLPEHSRVPTIVPSCHHAGPSCFVLLPTSAALNILLFHPF